MRSGGEETVEKIGFVLHSQPHLNSFYKMKKKKAITTWLWKLPHLHSSFSKSCFSFRFANPISDLAACELLPMAAVLEMLRAKNERVVLLHLSECHPFQHSLSNHSNRKYNFPGGLSSASHSWRYSTLPLATDIPLKFPALVPCGPTFRPWDRLWFFRINFPHCWGCRIVPEKGWGLVCIAGWAALQESDWLYFLLLIIIVLPYYLFYKLQAVQNVTTDLVLYSALQHCSWKTGNMSPPPSPSSNRLVNWLSGSTSVVRWATSLVCTLNGRLSCYSETCSPYNVSG